MINSARGTKMPTENLEVSASAASTKRKIMPVRQSRNLNSREKYFLGGTYQEQRPS